MYSEHIRLLKGLGHDVGTTVPEGTVEQTFQQMKRDLAESQLHSSCEKTVLVKLKVEDAQQFPTSAGYGADVINEVGLCI